MTIRSSLICARTLAAAGFLALAASCLAFAQRPIHLPPQSQPGNVAHGNSLGPFPSVDQTAPERAEVAARVYRAIFRGEARRFLVPPRVGEPPPDAAAVFDSRLAERLAEWSLRWMRAAQNAGGRAAWVEAARAHLGRMRDLESGRAVQEALKEESPAADRPVDVTRLGEFVEVARFYRLDAESRFQNSKSR